jgi:hypothetical protein
MSECVQRYTGPSPWSGTEEGVALAILRGLIDNAPNVVTFLAYEEAGDAAYMAIPSEDRNPHGMVMATVALQCALGRRNLFDWLTPGVDRAVLVEVAERAMHLVSSGDPLKLPPPSGTGGEWLLGKPSPVVR